MISLAAEYDMGRLKTQVRKTKVPEDGICKYGIRKYEYARVENSSTENASTNLQRWKNVSTATYLRHLGKKQSVIHFLIPLENVPH